MQIQTDVLALLGAQVQHELDNHKFYLICSHLLDAVDLDNLAAFMRKQSNEELEHATGILDYIAERGSVSPFQSPDSVTVPGSPIEMFNTALVLEQRNTTLLKNLHQAALVADSQAAIFLEKYLIEQVEEEDLFTRITRQFKLACATSEEFGVFMMEGRISEIK